MTTKQRILAFEEQKNILLNDPYRPLYHLALLNQYGLPGDPNGGFYANGRYHMMFLYEDVEIGYKWAHLSTTDLLHWRHHRDAIGPTKDTGGCFSGGGFVENDKAYLTYWQLPIGYSNHTSLKGTGIGIAEASSPLFEDFVKRDELIIESDEFGYIDIKNDQGELVESIGASDPSNIWKHNGKYYMLTGNLQVLDKHGRNLDSKEEYKGDFASLFESDDLIHWTYKHRFYQRDRTNHFTEISEDSMCASFLPLPSTRLGGKLSNKHLLLFISHNFGCQYYVGTYKDDHFYPELHGRLSSYNREFFAPEAIMDQNNRQIFMAWLGLNLETEIDKGWSGVYSIPRTVWYENDEFKMAPIDEIKRLRYQTTSFNNVLIDKEGFRPKINLDAVEIEFNLMKNLKVILYNKKNETQYTSLYIDYDKEELIIDSTHSNSKGIKKIDFIKIKPVSIFKSRLFIDKGILELFIGDKYAISKRLYLDYEPAIKFESTKEIKMNKIVVHDLMPTNPF